MSFAKARSMNVKKLIIRCKLFLRSATFLGYRRYRRIQKLLRIEFSDERRPDLLARSANFFYALFRYVYGLHASSSQRLVGVLVLTARAYDELYTLFA